MHPPPGQTGCPELGPGRERERGWKLAEARQPTVIRYTLHVQSHLHCCYKNVALLYFTSSLLLSRLDFETSSIFICQNLQMSRHCCGHAVAQQASVKTGLQSRRGNSSQRSGTQTPFKPKCVNQYDGLNVMQLLTTSRFKRCQGDTSHVHNLRITQNRAT